MLVARRKDGQLAVGGGWVFGSGLLAVGDTEGRIVEVGGDMGKERVAGRESG